MTKNCYMCGTDSELVIKAFMVLVELLVKEEPATDEHRGICLELAEMVEKEYDI